MIKAKNQHEKLIKHESYKKYRNEIIALIRQSKQIYYQHYFEKNKEDSKRIWQGVCEIMSSRKNKNSGNRSGIITDDNAIIDPGEIEENFNFFISIGTNLQKKPLLLKKRLQIIC